MYVYIYIYAMTICVYIYIYIYIVYVYIYIYIYIYVLANIHLPIKQYSRTGEQLYHGAPLNDLAVLTSWGLRMS